MTDTISRLNAALEGRYRIESELGQGGMATVYLADDIKHERKVALKVLKPELAAVVGAERFLAEIKTTANLQHPHILPLFDSGEADSFLFYVMPYVEGETLRQRIDREKQLPVDEALGIATAVAGALQTAHEAGVIHRDIKPGNILLSRGQPLVADFGIALAVSAGGSGRLTETGLSLGTPYYMSPEQATGDQAVGPASDTFALACVLYEMLVGEPPYPGTTAQAVLGKIIQGLPVSATAVRKSVPANVDAAIRKALEKLPADRFSSAQDFARALGDAGFRHGVAGTAAVGSEPGIWKRLAIAATVVAALFALSTGWLLLDTNPPSPPQVTRDVLTFLEGQEFDEVDRLARNSIALSPDGRELVYPGNGGEASPGQLWRRRLDELGASPIPGTMNARFPAYSYDGEYLSFSSGGEIRVMPVRGGTPVSVEGSSQHAWGDDGAIYWHEGGGWVIWRWVPGTAPTVVTHLDPGPQELSDVLPGSGAALVWNESSVSVVDLESGERRELALGRGAKYLESGHIVFAREDGTLMVQPFDLRSRSLTGPPVPTADAVSTIGIGAEYALARDGSLVYGTRTGERLGESLAWVDEDGTLELIEWPEPWPVDYDGVSLDPSGTRVAVGIRRPGEGFVSGDIWHLDLTSGTAFPLTTDGRSVRPDWHPRDGRIAYVGPGPDADVDVVAEVADRAARWVPADGSGPGGHIVDLASGAPPEVLWVGDGDEVVLRMGGVSGRSIFRLVRGQETPTPWLDDEFDHMGPRASPDGAWLAYQSNRSGRLEVYVRPYPDGGGVTPISSAGGQSPVWSPSGDAIYFNSLQGLWKATISIVGDRLEVVSRERLSDFGDVDFDVAPDGRLLMVRAENGGGSGDLILVRNWVQDVTRESN